MKKLVGVLALVLLAGTGCYVYVPYDESRPRPPREETYEPERGYYGDVDTTYFYDELRPYGLWVNYRPYGFVWLPRDVGYKWRPYHRGHWVWTDYGWTWVSFERWGSIVYHYGRWGWDGRLGWYWVPDIIWGPAWVAWRWGDIHIGWAPLPPGVEFHPGRGFGPHRWDFPGHHWNFVLGRDFLDRSVDRWILPVERNVTIINVTVVNVNINVRDNRVVNEGVDVGHVQRLTRRPVERLALKEAPRAGGDRLEGREVVVYKPQVRRNESARPKDFVEEDKVEGPLDVQASGRVYTPGSRSEEVRLRRMHEQETRLLQESQESEISEIRHQAESDKSKLQNPADKQKRDEELKARVAEVKKKHADEKTEMNRRQKAEEEKTKKTPVRRKVDKG